MDHSISALVQRLVTAPSEMVDFDFRDGLLLYRGRIVVPTNSAIRGKILA